jgi:hypothetical protein
MFLEWCKSHHYWWNTGSGYVEDGCKYYYCSVGEFRTGNAYTLSNVEGATPSEARARAIVEAGSN